MSVLEICSQVFPENLVLGVGASVVCAGEEAGYNALPASDPRVGSADSNGSVVPHKAGALHDNCEAPICNKTNRLFESVCLQVASSCVLTDLK